VPVAPPSTVAVIVTGPTYVVVPTLNIAVDTPISASVTRLNDPMAAPVLVLAEYVTSRRGLTVPIERRSVTRIDVLAPDFRSTASGATNTRSGSAGVNWAVVSAVTPSTVAVMRATPLVVPTSVVRATLLPSASAVRARAGRASSGT
jgi:hypothetical protein